MSNSEAAGMLRASGLPVVYYEWPDGASPEYPCIRYVDAGREDFVADGSNYFKLTRYNATLVAERKDESAEARLEEALESAGVVYAKGETVYVDAERLFQVDYSFVLPG